MKSARGSASGTLLDPDFRPPIRALRALQDAVRESGEAHSLSVALERGRDDVSRHEMALVPPDDPLFPAALGLSERWIKLLLWSRGAAKIYVAGDPEATAHVQVAYGPGGPRSFDRELMGKVYDGDLEIVVVEPQELPAGCDSTRAVGGHFDGCRIGFDLGASDCKFAAVIDGRTVFSEEIPWQPEGEADPQYHLEHIRSGLDKAAAHLPRVDAIGGSAAGVYVDNRVKVASLFRSVPSAVFTESVENMFVDIGERWGVPLTVINDGDVAALAGALSFGTRGILGIAMGSSQAGGYLDREGRISGWLNELAFAPVDLSPRAPVDEWSGDLGVGASYFSQQAVFRLAAAAGLDAGSSADDAVRLEKVQGALGAGSEKARRVFETIGTVLGYTIPWYRELYDFDTLLLLGRVTSGAGGEVICDRARGVLSAEFPGVAERVVLHLPDEKSRRIGQAVAAASLPAVP